MGEIIRRSVALNPLTYLVALFCSVQLGYSVGGLRLSISAIKDTLVEGEFVWFTVQLNNETDKPVSIYRFDSWGGEISYVVKHASGDTLPCHCINTDYLPGKSLPLKVLVPGDSIWTIGNLLLQFGTYLELVLENYIWKEVLTLSKPSDIWER